jgi:transketolase
MGKADLGDVHVEKIVFPEGGALPVLSGSSPNQVAFVATGSMLKVATGLARDSFPGVSVWSVIELTTHVGKDLSNALSQARAVVSLEEHCVRGGLGGMLAEWLTEHAPKRLLRVGITEGFSKKCGSYEYLLDEHLLSPQHIEAKVAAFMQSLDSQ